ncbi:MAG: hypothetical protein GY891_07375 [Bacteroidetes bacterium]|nr:hypothetical protein [Bacteroidota bacterium]
MANICTNRIYFYADQSAIDWFEKTVNDLDDEGFIEQFGSEGPHNIERIGCKWITKDDWDRPDETTYYLGFESAWYPPDTMIKNMVAQLQKHDESAYADGRYWDEAFDPIGIFQCNGPDTWYSDEASVDVDWENEMYWDEEVEPAFDELEL